MRCCDDGVDINDNEMEFELVSFLIGMSPGSVKLNAKHGRPKPKARATRSIKSVVVNERRAMHDSRNSFESCGRSGEMGYLDPESSFKQV
jgi:hypothetical protein